MSLCMSRTVKMITWCNNEVLHSGHFVWRNLAYWDPHMICTNIITWTTHDISSILKQWTSQVRELKMRRIWYHSLALLTYLSRKSANWTIDKWVSINQGQLAIIVNRNHSCRLVQCLVPRLSKSFSNMPVTYNDPLKSSYKKSASWKSTLLPQSFSLSNKIKIRMM